MSQKHIEPSDFADQMKALAEEAERQVSGDSREDSKKTTTAAPPGLLQMLRPLVLGMEALSRATVENTMTLSRLEAASTNQDMLSRMASQIQEKFDGKNEINQQLFDALHQELKGYKDGFILEVIQKPLVRDLITLYDDLAEVHRQMDCFVTGLDADKAPNPVAMPMGIHIKNMRTNVHHVMQFLIEIMARMEVNIQEPTKGKLNKTTQRAVSVELADLEAEDGDIIRSLKPGFMWRDRLVRAEEVVIKKWKEGFLVAIQSDLKEGNTVQTGTSDAI